VFSGNTHFNKILASLDIPVFNKNTHQMHEKEVGKVAEEMAQDSCTSYPFGTRTDNQERKRCSKIVVSTAAIDK